MRSAARVRELVYIKLDGWRSAGRRPSSRKADATAKALDARERLIGLIAAYDNERRGYRSREMPYRVTDKGDYDHLARVRRVVARRGRRMSAGELPPLATDPGVSAWVSANAGAGKTHVLTDRVTRLLLDGARPGAHSLPHLHEGGGGRDGLASVRAAGRVGAAARSTR